MSSRRSVAWVAAVALVAGMSALWGAPRSHPAASISNGPVTIDAVPVPFNPQNPSETAIGDFTYAGGLALTSRDTDRLHGLSDLEVTASDRLSAVSDFGMFLEARVVLDRSARLVGLTDASLAPLHGEDGRPLVVKADSDAEGLALLPSGDRLVSFEEHDRILRYPPGGGVPRPAPFPATGLTFNAGMEALASDPDAGADAYVVGIELTGETWSCRLSSATCLPGLVVDKGREFGLVAMRRLPGAQTAYLLRAFDLVRGNRISLVIMRASTVVARMDMAPPQTVDNFEGLAAVPRTDGGVRFYLMSDDNGVARQRTLLLAFDWHPR